MKQLCCNRPWLLCLSWLFGALSASTVAAKDLPLHELVPTKTDKPLIIYVSGDGGWNNFSDELTKAFWKQGYGVIGLDARKYFWQAKTPEKLAAVVASLAKEKMHDWHLQRFVLIGYSFGADVCAFVPGQLSDDLQQDLSDLVLISPAESSHFEVRLSDMLSMFNKPGKYKVAEALRGNKLPTLCVFGEGEEKDWLSVLDMPQLQSIVLPGGHHYENNYEKVVKTVTAWMADESG